MPYHFGSDYDRLKFSNIFFYYIWLWNIELEIHYIWHTTCLLYDFQSWSTLAVNSIQKLCDYLCCSPLWIMKILAGIWILDLDGWFCLPNSNSFLFTARMWPFLNLWMIWISKNCGSWIRVAFIFAGIRFLNSKKSNLCFQDTFEMSFIIFSRTFMVLYFCHTKLLWNGSLVMWWCNDGNLACILRCIMSNLCVMGFGIMLVHIFTFF